MSATVDTVLCAWCGEEYKRGYVGNLAFPPHNCDVRAFCHEPTCEAVAHNWCQDDVDEDVWYFSCRYHVGEGVIMQQGGA